MPEREARVLIVDDEEQLVALALKALSKADIKAVGASNVDRALQYLAGSAWDVLLVDINLDGESGIELAQKAVEMVPGLSVIVMTAFGTVDNAISAIRAGAYDFVTKPFDLLALRLLVERATRHTELVRELATLKQHTAPRAISDLIGASEQIREVASLVERVAKTDVTVLVSGESGTGKELVASAIHDQSDRANMPFIPVNCGALPPELLGSELFGHEKGAFTGAARARPGLFVEAHQGTLFLDEVGEMPPEMQVRLLRALQEGRVRPVGGDRERDVDVRVVCATNRDLRREVDEGRFREDLYYRINVVEIRIPPLRERGTDALLIARYFVREAAERLGRKVSGIDENAARKLLAYDWPGNVRELRNAMERGVALTRWPTIAVEDLPPRVQTFESEDVDEVGESGLFLTLEELERRYIRKVMSHTQENKAESARILGIDRRTLYRKLERYEDA